MNKTMRILLASCGTLALATAASADTVRIGITQNNVGIDSYQTTYERAFIAAAEANPDVEVIVLDAGGDVARQISQMQDLIQQQVDAIIIWPTDGQALVPAVRNAHNAGIPVVVTNFYFCWQYILLTSTHKRTGQLSASDHISPVFIFPCMSAQG